MALSDVTIPSQLFLDGPAVLATEIWPDGRLAVISQADVPTVHLRASLRADADETAGAPLPSPPDLSPADPAAFYERAKAVGIDYGSCFRGLVALAVQGAWASGRVELPPAAALEAAHHAVHPALLDAAFHVAGAVLTSARPGEAFVPAGVQRATLHEAGATKADVIAHVTVGSPGGTASADLDGFSADGTPLFAVRRLKLAPAPKSLVAKTDTPKLKPAEPTPVTEGPSIPQHLAPHLYEIAFSPPEVVDTGDHQADPGPLDGLFADAVGLKNYGATMAAIEEKARAFALRAVNALCAGASGTIESLAERASVVDSQRHLFARLLKVAEASGSAACEDGIFKVSRAIKNPPQLVSADGDRPLSALLDAAGPALSDVIKGRRHPLDVLFPGGEDNLVRALYTGSPAFGAMQEGAARTVAALAATSSRPIRVLEVGGGTGSTTERVLPALSGRLDAYVFTDAAALLVERAARRFSDEPGFSTRVMDLERDPQEAGLEEASFDLVIAANVVHATRDVSATLSRLRKLLTPGGHVVLVEGTTPWLWADITFGLTDGWWRFSDRWRADHPLLPDAAWPDVLADAGFERTRVLAPRDEKANLPGQAIVLGRAPRKCARAHVIGEGALASAIAQACGVDEAVGHTILVWRNTPQLDDVSAAAEAIEVLNGAAESGSTVTLITHGAFGSTGPEGETGCAGAAAWGIARSAQREHPSLLVDVIDVSSMDPDVAARAIAAHQPIGGALLRLTESGLAKAELTRWRPPASTRAPIDLRKASVLVTGAFGGLGAVLVDHFLQKGVARVVAVGRTVPPESYPRAVREPALDCVACDVGDPASVAALAAHLNGGPPVRAIIHAAGVVDDAPLSAQTPARLEATFRAKVSGTLNLCAFEEARVVLFSSATGVVGVPGQANHAAACAIEDAIAAWRSKGREGSMTSVAFGPFAQVGAAVRTGVAETATDLGIEPMVPDDALALVDAILCGAPVPPRLVAIKADWVRHRTSVGADPLTANLAGEPARAPPVSAPHAPAPSASRTPQTTETEPHSAHVARKVAGTAEAEVAALVRATLGFAADAPIDMDAGLFDLGIDSLTAIELKRALETRLGRALPVSLAFAYPTPRAIAAFLEEPAGHRPAPSAEAAAPAEQSLEAMNDALDAELEKLGLAHA
ncbi:MAG: SDR family NAD(P)-dependent oxidoreductase [Pseudomonadota bacterium]